MILHGAKEYAAITKVIHIQYCFLILFHSQTQCIYLDQYICNCISNHIIYISEIFFGSDFLCVKKAVIYRYLAGFWNRVDIPPVCLKVFDISFSILIMVNCVTKPGPVLAVTVVNSSTCALGPLKTYITYPISRSFWGRLWSGCWKPLVFLKKVGYYIKTLLSEWGGFGGGEVVGWPAGALEAQFWRELRIGCLKPTPGIPHTSTYQSALTCNISGDM